ncbi:MAG: DUF4965 domain-containing protein [Fimbriimonadaceae bacterium]|nr:DUF4965 domain-containing protein [Fimbriimonadaceae bacterium]
MLVACLGLAMSLPVVRPPAVPLVVHDPYLSVWSPYDRLTDGWPVHWTGVANGMAMLLRVDGKPYRVCGPAPREAPPMAQFGLEVRPTTTEYRFEEAGVRLILRFVTPTLPKNLDVLSRPITYVVFEVASADGRPHDVAAYLDLSGEWCVDDPSKRVAWGRLRLGDVEALHMGPADQKPLNRAGDQVRIDWGYAYLAASRRDGWDTVVASDRLTRGEFVRTGRLPDSDDTDFPRSAAADWPMLAAAVSFGEVSANPVAKVAMIGYDDIESIEYFGRRLKAYWRRDGGTFGELLKTAHAEYPSLAERCAAFDRDLIGQLEAAGGPNYAAIASLAYRQSIAAHKLVADIDGRPLMFSKENNSNGCVATVDVTYPASPLYLLVNPELLRAQIEPILDYASFPRWKWDFAPHDLGTYPLANGQVYGGGERTEENQMPVEESGNMLAMVEAYLARGGDLEFVRRHQGTLRKWADYLVRNGLDPAEQLCTDDFAGHLARNANLSVKAIMGIAAYGATAARLGLADEARRYRAVAQDYSAKWRALATDGDRTVLAFGTTGTWSQKYNLVWDRLLGFGLFHADVAAREVAAYKRLLGKYGLPLDNRAGYTKLDWIFWSAALAEGRADQDAILAPCYVWLNETPSRVPLTDWYETGDGRYLHFRARSVVGGLFMPALKAAMIRR